MKTPNIIRLLGLTFFTVFVSSCVQSAEHAATPFPTEKALSLGSTATSLPSFTPLPIASAIPTSTPTMISALPVEEAQRILLDFLATNGDCRLPCLWGITIGKSSYQDVRAILMPLSSLSHSVFLDSPELGGIIPRYIEGELEIYAAIGFTTNPSDEIVNHVTFNTEAHRLVKKGGYEDIFDSNFFGETVQVYALPNILSEQGVPSSVMVATFGAPLTRGGTGGFDILLLYPDQGILVNYTAQMQLVGANVRGCPTNAHVEMELYPPNDSDSFFEGLEQTDWSVKLNYYKPLEEVTDLSLEQFHEMFRQPTDECIETPANLWSIPEQ